DLEAVIKNRPAEFADAVERSDWDEFWRIAEQVEKMNKQNPPVPFYKKIQPAAGKKASTKRYERTRRYHPLSIGLIERQFGESHGRGLLLPDFELSQTCIDGILTGGTVDMATLEQWFGRDRKLLPSGLNGKRSHRTILYDYSFLARCF